MDAVMSRCPTCARVFRGDALFCPHDGAALARTASDASDPWLGRVLAERYRLQSLVGRGGMGVVYAAEQLAIGRLVAVKLLTPERQPRPEARQRFLREAQAVSRLKSPWTVTLFDFGQDGDVAFIVMELLSGGTLRTRLREAGALPWQDVVRVLAQITRALVEAHQLGIVHRDLKPDNIALEPTPDGGEHVKVLDFGIARLVDEPDEGPLTATSQIPGTPQYLAPERVAGEPLGPASDLYALGIIAYELLTGTPPYRGSTWDVMHQHVTGRPKALAEAAPDRLIPSELEALVWRALARSPELRPDATTFLDALARLDRPDPHARLGAGVVHATVDHPRPRRTRVPVVAIAAAALGVGVGLGWLAHGGAPLVVGAPPVLVAAPLPAPASIEVARPEPASIEVARPEPEPEPEPHVVAEPAARPRPATTRKPEAVATDSAPAEPAPDPNAGRIDKLLP